MTTPQEICRPASGRPRRRASRRPAQLARDAARLLEGAVALKRRTACIAAQVEPERLCMMPAHPVLGPIAEGR